MRNNRPSPGEQVATFVGFVFFISIATMGLFTLVYVPISMVVASFN